MSLQKKPEELRNGYKDKERLKVLHDLPCIVCEKLNIKQSAPTEAHHLIGYGIGKKASDLLTISLCSKHHARGNTGEAIHETPLRQWESVYGTQEELLILTNEKLCLKNS